MNSINRALAALAILVIGVIAHTGSATAGTYTMKQCLGAQFLDFEAVYAPLNSSGNVEMADGCTPTGSGKFGVYQDRGGSGFTYGDGGRFRWTLPDGVRVIGTEFVARLKQANGLEPELIATNGNSIIDLEGGFPNDGDTRRSTWSDPTRPRTNVFARLVCLWVAGCPNGPTVTKAFIEVTDVEFTVSDISAPAVIPTGELWSWAGDGEYHRGTAAITAQTSDPGSGIAGVWIEVNGLRVNFPAPACPGDRGPYSSRFSPCPLSHNPSRNLDTSQTPFREGANQIRVCARDFAGTEAAANVTCSAVRTLRVDNERPAPPLDLRPEEGSEWQPENGFTIRWNNPPGQVSPVVRVAYLIQEAETGELVRLDRVDGAGIDTFGPIEVPDVGAWRVTVVIYDAAGNAGEPADTIIRFDDRPPGDVGPVPPEGWISRDELPLEQEVEKAEPGGPSGIAGYALSVSEDGPTPPCSTPVCLAPEITLAGGADQRTGSIGGLAEGDHWISAAAVSGAKRASTEPGSTMVQVDRTPPSTTISGAPGEWVNHPVTLTAHATDMLSGMQPEPDDNGTPQTVIDADNYATYASPGPFATFSVATEGINRIRYWAEDLAGNANDGRAGPDGDIHPNPGQVVVRIDTSPPEFVFNAERDPEDPELVSLDVDDADSGVARARISIRRAGSGEQFTELPTSGSGGRYQARVPSDELPRGSYEMRATVEDKAGNQGSGNLSDAGEPMILNLPLKQPVKLTTRLPKGKRLLTIRYGKKVFVQGRLTSAGAPLANQAIRVIETYPAGSRRSSATRTATTDGTGRYRVNLGHGPSRKIEVVFDGTRKLSRVATRRLQLRVRSRVGFQIRPRKVVNGRAVKMKGRVGFRGALPPARGKLVAIQYLDPSRGKWRPVEVLRTNRKGRFRYTYRFRTISSAQRIIFRASVLPEAGWPYLPSTSKPKSVIVYPKS